MQAQNELLSNQSMVILGKEGEMFSHQYSFSGLEGILQQFMLDMCGAARTPATRLFGRTITGLGQSNDGDERIYEETIAQEQMQELDPNIKKLYPVVMMSEFGETPKDWDITYPSIRVLTEEDKKKLAKDGTDAVVVAFNAGLISPRVATKELQQMADTTGFYSNITPEDIEAASPKLQQMGEMDMGGGESGEQPEPDAEPQPEPSEHDMRQLKHLIDGQGKDADTRKDSPNIEDRIDYLMEMRSFSRMSGNDSGGAIVYSRHAGDTRVFVWIKDDEVASVKTIFSGNDAKEGKYGEGIRRGEGWKELEAVANAYGD
jgi:hypothetical protein